MNEQANVQTVQALYAAFERGDLEAVLAGLAEDVEWWSAGPPDVPYAGSFKGHDGVMRYLAAIDGSFAYDGFEAREFVAQGDAVVVLGHERLRAKTTGTAIDNPWVNVFTFRGGKVARYRNFEDTAAVASSLPSG